MNNKLITKALLIFAGLALTLSMFTACVDDKAFADVEKNVEDLESTVTADMAELKKVETELRALADGIKTTAEAAATQAALEDAIATLKAADTTNTQAAADALTAAQTALQASLQANADADAATRTAMEEAKNAIDNAIAAVKTTADAAATADALDLAKEALQNAYEAADAALDAKITTLTNSVNGINATIGDFAADFEDTTVTAVLKALQIQANSLRTDVDALKAAQTVSAFVSGYDLATKILAGEATLEDFGGDNAAYTKYSAYSMAKFIETVRLIESRETWYIPTDFTAFLTEKDTVEFFLTRATSKETVEELFTQFNAYVADMPSLTDLLNTALTTIEDGKLVTEDAGVYQNATDILAEIDAVNNNHVDPDDDTSDLYTDDDIDTTSAEFIALQTRYDTIEAAQENLLSAIGAAPDVVTLIEAVDSPYIYSTSYSELGAALAAFDDFEDTYFSNDAYTALYNGEEYTAVKLVTDDTYDYLVAAYERYAVLEEAKSNAPTELNDAFKYFYDSALPERPLYTKLDDLMVQASQLNSWIGKYELEAVNVDMIIMGNTTSGVYNAITDATTYAEDMLNIYYEMVVDTYLVENITTNLIEKDKVYYSDLAYVTEYRNALNDLDAAIKNVDNWTDVGNYAEGRDGDNYHTMLADVLADFEDIETRMIELDTANNEIQTLITTILQPKVGNVGYQDYPILATNSDSYLSKIEAISSNRNIPEDDVNYETIIGPAMDIYDALIAEYEEKTAAVAEVYAALLETIKSKEEGTWTLADGNDIWDNNQKVVNLPIVLGVGNTDIDLTVIIDEDTTIEANLKDIIDQWYATAGEFQDWCVEAAADAVAVNDAIEALGAAADLNNFAAINAAVELYNEWAGTHLNGADIANVQNIKKLGSNDIYEFVLINNYNDLMAKDAAADNAMTAAGENFTNVVAPAFAAVAAGAWDIHSAVDFTAADTAWTGHLNTYYGGAIEATTAEGAGFYGETAAYADYTTEKTAFGIKLDAAETARGDIAELLADLPTLEAIYNGTADAADAESAANAIYTAIAQYKTDFGCDILTCTDGWDALSEADQVKLAKVLGYAQFVQAFTAADDGTSDFDVFALNAYAIVSSADVDTLAEVEIALTNINDNLAELKLTHPVEP